jgi:hypothetical protein
VAYETGRGGRMSLHTAYCRRPEALHEACVGNAQLPIYSAAFMANFDYVRWKLLQDSYGLPDVALEFLHYFSLMGYRFYYDMEESVWNVELLIQ